VGALFTHDERSPAAQPGRQISLIDHDDRGTRILRSRAQETPMSESGGTSAPRPKADNDEDASRKDVNPDLHGQAKDVEEKRANDDPETTGA
jgi:hypothetical protein